MLTLEAIEEIMDAEIKKPIEVMDTELIDACASILAKAYNPGFKEEMPAEMFCPWDLSDDEKNEFSEENIIKMINKEKKKLPFLRDYDLIHESYLLLSECYGYTYNNEYEEKAERQIERRKRIRHIKSKFIRKMK